MSQQTAANSSASTPGIRKLTSKPLPPDSLINNYSLSITDTLYAIFDRAIQAQFSFLPENSSVLITGSKIADYQCNSAMAISQVNIFKRQNTSLYPKCFYVFHILRH